VEETKVGSNSDTIRVELDVLATKENASSSSRDTRDSQTVQ
jgi:hypothetical protein